MDRQQQEQAESVVPTAVVAIRQGWRRARRGAAAGRICIFVGASFVAMMAIRNSDSSGRSRKSSAQKVPSVEAVGSASNADDCEDSVEDFPESASSSMAPAFLQLDEQDGRFCGKEGDMCKCFGHVRYGRLFSWSDDLIVDGSVNCSAATFGDPVPMSVKICKCYPTICTTDMGICTPEPCGCPTSRDPAIEWAKKTLMTGDGTKCWACEKHASTAGVAVDDDTDYCPTTPGRCTLKKSCKCESASDKKRIMKTKAGDKCWTCAAAGEGGGAFKMDSGQKAMFWMLPLLWPWMNLPDSAWEVINGCRAIAGLCGLMLAGYFCQTFAQFLRLDGYLSFYAPCMKKGEFWRLFTYFVLHSDLQHLCVNLFHLLDALDLEGVPDLEVSPGVPLKCTKNGPIAQICYPDVGIGFNHVVAIFAVTLAYGALIGTIRNFTAIVQGASSICFGVDGALIALYGMFLGAGLDQQLKIPQFGAFFWMRIGIIGFHIIIDVFQSICGGGKDTVGTMAHMASLVAGFCYVILVLPPMGDGTFFDSEVPYIVDCGLTSPYYTNMDEATSQCLAFFKRSNGLEVGTAKKIAVSILGGGVLLAIVNAIRNRHESADGVACCSDSQPKMASRDMGVEEAVAEDVPENSPQAELAELKKARTDLSESLEILQRLHRQLPDLAPATA